MSTDLTTEPPTGPIAPTVTMKWLTCPTLGYLSQRWAPTGAWTPNMLLGSAVGDGLDALFLGKDLDEAERVTVERLNNGWVEQDDWPLDALTVLAIKGLKAANKTTVEPLMAQERTIAAQLDVGGARLDLVSERKTLAGTDLIVTDHKVSLQMKTEYVAKNLLTSEADWQLWDYAWRASSYYGRPVTHLRRHQIVLSPTAKSYLHEFPVHPTFLKAWLAGAEEEWAFIHRMRALLPDEVPMRLTSCNGRYGRCEMYDACHVAHRDPVAMRAMFTERR